MGRWPFVCLRCPFSLMRIKKRTKGDVVQKRILIFAADKKLLCICLNDSVEWRLRKLSVTIWQPYNCAELLRFASRRTTLCKYSVFLGNSKIDDCVNAKCGQNLPSALFNQRRRSCSFSSSRCIRRFRRSRNLSRK